MSTDDGELGELRELTESAGWTRVCAHIEDLWGPEACLAKIDRALQELPPGDVDAERQTVLQIRVAAKQMNALKTWPAERIRQLVQPRGSANPLDRLRRIGR